MADELRIVLVDDHPLFREGVARTLNGENDIKIVGEGGTAAEAIALAEEQLPDVVLLDISMPGSGIEAARRISETCPVVKIVMLTVSESDDDVTAALRAGARGYILKGVSGPQLVGIIRAVSLGESYVSPGLAARLLREVRTGDPTREGTVPPDSMADLTAREIDILRRVARGLSNKEVARELDLAEKTVKHHMTNILQKLQVRNRVEAALLARDRALHSDD